MYYGFDIGGTKIALGVFDSTRHAVGKTGSHAPYQLYAFLDAVYELVEEADQRFGVLVGRIGTPETEDGNSYRECPGCGKPLRADPQRPDWIAMCVCWTMTLTVLPCPEAR